MWTRKQTKNIAYYGVFTALALLMGYIEHLIPMPVAIYGVKLGLANVVVLTVLYFMGEKSAVLISFVRILINTMLFSTPAAFLYSAFGALLSFIAMALAKRSRLFSIVGVSVLGGVFHNIGQIIAAIIVIDNLNVIYYLPVLIVSGIITGVATGLVGKYCMTYLSRFADK